VTAQYPESLPEPLTQDQAADPLADAPRHIPDLDPKSPANDRRNLYALMLGALGVVFGDIGTSPLYALRATVLATEGGLPNHVAVMGSLSMIFWALILV